jgi:hypothetical protein
MAQPHVSIAYRQSISPFCSQSAFINIHGIQNKKRLLPKELQSDILYNGEATHFLSHTNWVFSYYFSSEDQYQVPLKLFQQLQA